MSVFVQFKGPKLSHPRGHAGKRRPCYNYITMQAKSVFFSIKDHIKVIAYSNKTKCLQCTVYVYNELLDQITG